MWWSTESIKWHWRAHISVSSAVRLRTMIRSQIASALPKFVYFHRFLLSSSSEPNYMNNTKLENTKQSRTIFPFANECFGPKVYTARKPVNPLKSMWLVLTLKLFYPINKVNWQNYSVLHVSLTRDPIHSHAYRKCVASIRMQTVMPRTIHSQFHE